MHPWGGTAGGQGWPCCITVTQATASSLPSLLDRTQDCPLPPCEMGGCFPQDCPPHHPWLLSTRSRAYDFSL